MTNTHTIKRNENGGVDMTGYGTGGGFALVVVLFILLIIIGASYGGGSY